MGKKGTNHGKTGILLPLLEVVPDVLFGALCIANSVRL